MAWEASVLTERYACDVCFREKHEANHWFRVWARSDALQVRPWGEDRLAIKDEHICGEECLHKRLSRWLVEGK